MLDSSHLHGKARLLGFRSRMTRVAFFHTYLSIKWDLSRQLNPNLQLNVQTSKHQQLLNHPPCSRSSP